MLDYDFLHCNMAEGGLMCILFCLSLSIYISAEKKRKKERKLSQFTLQNLMNSSPVNVPFPEKFFSLFYSWCHEAISIL